MAFERVLQSSNRERATSRWTLAGVGIAHGVLVFGGVIHSTWNIEELDPPKVAITLSIPPAFAADLPPRRAEPRKRPGSGGSNQFRKKAQPAQPLPATAQQTTRDLDAKLAPPEGPGDPAIPSTEPGTGERGEGTGPGSGIGSGVGPGDSGDSGGGVFAPPTIGAKQCLDCPPPHLSPAYLSVVGQARMLLKICVDRSGQVDRVSVLQGLGEAQNALVVSTIQAWRYTPMTVNGSAVPFCYASRFTFSLQ